MSFIVLLHLFNHEILIWFAGKHVLLHFETYTRTKWRHLRALYSHKARSILVHLIHALYKCDLQDTFRVVGKLKLHAS